MKKELHVHIFLILNILTTLSFAINIVVDNKLDILDLDQEINKKMDDLLSYYKHIIQNTNYDESNKIKIMNTLNSRAESMIKRKLKDITKITQYSDDKTVENDSFIQNLSVENNESSNYPPFAWIDLKINNGPSPRRGHSAVLADTYLIVFGGCLMDSKCYNDLYFLDLTSQKWSQVPTTGKIPTPREGHSAILYGSTMYIYGGSNSDGFMSDLYSLSLETREWKKIDYVGALTAGRAGHGAVIDNDSRIIIIGGYSDKGYLNDLFVINLLEERFETPLTTGKPPSSRQNFAFALVNNIIYLFGGFQESGVLNDAFSIDISTWNWKPLKLQGPNPPALQGMAFTRVGKKLYLTGGCDFRLQQCFTDTFFLDTESLWWTKVEINKNELTGRDDFSLTFFRGGLYTFGGCEMYKNCFNNVFIMNINDLCPDKCSGNGECKDIIGCVCNSPWVSHDCSQKIKCKDNCNNNGLCHNNAKCGCYPGWIGSLCNTLIACPMNCTDVQNGVCQNDHTCKCKSGFTGQDCSKSTNNENNLNVDPFKELNSIESQKVNENTKELEKESPNFAKLLNTTTQSNTTKICPKNCSNNGDCNKDTGMCNCKLDFTGEDCSVDFKNPIILKKAALNQTQAKRTNNGAEQTNKTQAQTTNQTQTNRTNETQGINATDAARMNGKKEDQENNQETENTKKIIHYVVGANNDVYYETTGCKNNCTNKGMCLNSTCFCNQGFTSDDCSMKYKEYMNTGIKLSGMIKFIVIAFIAAMIVTLIVLIYKKSQKISGDNLTLDDID